MSIKLFSYTQKNLAYLPPRIQVSNKGTYGRVVCVCGSLGMSGAAYLCAKAVMRSGAGLVEVVTPEENRIILQTLFPEAIVTPYDRLSPELTLIDNSIERADAVVCGCGLGVSRESRALLSHVLKICTVPTVLDADALNLLSRNPSLLKYARGKIITPHLGEMSRLCGMSIEEISADAVSVCHSFAERYGVVCVLKGHRTCVSDGGNKVYLNNSGNSGMSTAGAGDVLAGIIGGILSQSKNSTLTPFGAACLGVYIHGLAGDAAAGRVGEYSLIASDIVDALPLILK